MRICIKLVSCRWFILLNRRFREDYAVELWICRMKFYWDIVLRDILLWCKLSCRLCFVDNQKPHRSNLGGQFCLHDDVPLANRTILPIKLRPHGTNPLYALHTRGPFPVAPATVEHPSVNYVHGYSFPLAFCPLGHSLSIVIPSMCNLYGMYFLWCWSHQWVFHQCIAQSFYSLINKVLTVCSTNA